MILTGTLEASRANRNHRRLPNGAEFWRSELITVDGGAQVFLVEQEPHTVALPHFHLQDEFQVFVGGDGMLGRHPVRPITVHYANRHTGYGPITAGSDGVAYLTLRARLDLGAHFLPESRHLMADVPRRSLHGTPLESADADALRELEAPSLEGLLPAQPDGVAAWRLRVPSGAPLNPPTQTGARFYVVTSGELRLATPERLARCAAVFVPRDEPPLRAAAGDAGLELLVLQFADGS